MNVFALHQDPYKAAELQCDRHVVKMVLETAQLLCSAFPEGAAPYKRTHYNHPCAVWTRSSYGAFMWLVHHGYGLALEYHHRYGKEHKSLAVIQWCHAHVAEAGLPDLPWVPFAQAMPDEFKQADPVAAYRAYYIGAKADIAVWNKGRTAPEWWVKL